MTLAALIRGTPKALPAGAATAIHATAANEEGGKAGTVARVATVAVANHGNAKNEGTETPPRGRDARMADQPAGLRETFEELAPDRVWWCVSILEPGARTVEVDTPSGWTLAEWQAYAERYYGPACAVTPIAGLPEPRAPLTLDEALRAACEGVGGITPAQFRSLLSPEDVADIEAGAIHIKTIHGYVLSFAEGIRSGRLVPAVAP